MTADRGIDYDALTQDAMRGVVRAILSRVAKSGLPGDHHFFVAFDTRAAGVVLSRRLKEKYPDEMTIVLQHRFWDLAVTDDHFEVKLTFDGIPERLVVPFSALKVFFDPSVRYTLQFEDLTANEEPQDTGSGRRRENGPGRRAGAAAGAGAGGTSEAASEGTGPRPLAERRTRGRAKRSDKASDIQPPPAPVPSLAPRAEPPAKQDEASDTAAARDRSGAQIVNLDAFRKR